MNLNKCTISDLIGVYENRTNHKSLDYSLLANCLEEGIAREFRIPDNIAYKYFNRFDSLTTTAEEYCRRLVIFSKKKIRERLLSSIN